LLFARTTARTLCSVPAAASGVVTLAGQLLSRLDKLTDAIVTRIRTEIDFYAVGAQVTEEALRTSVRDNVRMVLSSFVAGGPPDLAPACATGRERAVQGAPLPEVLGAYRVGFADVWAELVAEARTTGVVDDATLVDVAADVWRLAGDFTNALTSAYRDTVTDLTLQRENERSVLVEALFTGVIAEDGTLWETAKVLRLPVTGHFVVVVAQTPAPGREALPGIETRLSASDIRSAWRLLPDQQIGVLSLPQPGAAETVLNLLRQAPAVRAGVSPAYELLRETPQSLHLARLALGGLAEDSPGAAQFEETPLAVLMAAVPAEADKIARRVFGPVLDLPTADRSGLLDTLRCWFDSAGSANRTGERLYCHPNTVRYRLRRIEGLTGRALNDPQAVAELSAALQALRLTPG
jgi:hypothetical protein